MRHIGILVIGLFVVLLFVMGCAAPQEAPKESAPSAIEEAPRPMPPEPAPPSLPSAPETVVGADAKEGMVVEEQEEGLEELPPGFTRLTLADPDNPIEIVSWGIERGPSNSAKLVNVTIIVRNTGREPIAGQVLFEAWQESIFFKKTWNIATTVPPGQSYTFTRDVGVTLDAPKLEKQMRAVLIVTNGVTVSGEDHKFFIPIR